MTDVDAKVREILKDPLQYGAFLKEMSAFLDSAAEDIRQCCFRGEVFPLSQFKSRFPVEYSVYLRVARRGFKCIRWLTRIQK